MKIDTFARIAYAKKSNRFSNRSPKSFINVSEMSNRNKRTTRHTPILKVSNEGLSVFLESIRKEHVRREGAVRAYQFRQPQSYLNATIDQ